MYSLEDWIMELKALEGSLLEDKPELKPELVKLWGEYDSSNAITSRVGCLFRVEEYLRRELYE